MLGLAIIISIVFAVLKILGFISLSWWLVIVPELFVFILFIILAVIAGSLVYKHERTIYNAFKEDKFRHGRLR